MKIAVTLYYIDFARYFRYLEKECQSLEADTEFLYVSFFPSAHGYLQAHEANSVFLPDELHKREPAAGNFSDLISYQAQLMPELAPELLTEETARCVSVYESLFADEDVDLLISSGDTRMQVEAGILVAKRHSVPILFFEQGAFGTTILDESGVNARVSFRLNEEEVDETVNLEQIELFRNALSGFGDELTTKQKWSEKLDLLYMYPLPFTNSRLPYYSQTGMSFMQFLASRVKAKFQNESSVPLPKRFVFLPLQMPIDAQMLYYSPLYDSFADLINDVAAALPNGCELVVREHPHFRGRYAPDVYDAVRQHSNVMVINDSNLQDTISMAEAVVVINSAVGIESISYYKKVLLVGDAYYEHPEVFKKLDCREGMEQALRELLSTSVDKAMVDRHLSTLLNRHLIPGHFRDRVLTGGAEAAKKIQESIQRDTGIV